MRRARSVARAIAPLNSPRWMPRSSLPRGRRAIRNWVKHRSLATPARARICCRSCPSWRRRARAKCWRGKKKRLGVFVSGHPLADVQQLLVRARRHADERLTRRRRRYAGGDRRHRDERAADGHQDRPANSHRAARGHGRRVRSRGFCKNLRSGPSALQGRRGALRQRPAALTRTPRRGARRGTAARALHRRQRGRGVRGARPRGRAAPKRWAGTST